MSASKEESTAWWTLTRLSQRLSSHVFFKHVPAVLGRDNCGKLSCQGRQEGDLAEKGGEWIAFVIALVSADLSVTSDVREKRHFANSGKVLYTEFIAGSTNLWVSGAKWKDRPLVCKLLRISRRQQ